MKRRMLVLLLAVTASISMSSAQEKTYDEKFGEDPAQRAENVKLLSFFQDAYNTKAYDDALNLLRQLIVRAPKSSMNMYINGGEIYRQKFARATTKVERMAYLDSMLFLLDKRMEYFGDHKTHGLAYLAAQKAMLFNENNPEDRERAFSLFREALKVSGNEVDPNMVVIFFQSLSEGFKLDDITPEEYIADYEGLTTLLAQVTTEENTKATETIEALFATSGAASCENIERIFRPKYEADPSNGELVKKILALFSRSKCSSDFQLSLTEQYYKIEPTPELALMLAGIYEEKKDFNKALEYINIGVAAETDATKKLNYLTRAAGLTLSANNYRAAADLSRQIIAIDPSNGYGYLFLAGAYAGGVSSCSGFDRQAAYWLVVDTYQQARAKFADDQTQVDRINSYINSYAASFPKTEETFMRGLEPGQGYTVNCGWVSGRTTVRER